MKLTAALLALSLTVPAMADDLGLDVYSLVKYLDQQTVTEKLGYTPEGLDPDDSVATIVIANMTTAGRITPEDLEEPRQMVRHFREAKGPIEFKDRMEAHYRARYGTLKARVAQNKGLARRVR